MDESFDFIEYFSDNIHTSLLTTPTIANFKPNIHDINQINQGLEKTVLFPYETIFDGIKINNNSIIVATHPIDATFLENIKSALGSVPQDLNIGGAWGSHITIGRFVGNITDKKILSELYDLIDKFSKNLEKSNIKITPKRITIGYLNVNTQNNIGSYFRITPIKFKTLDNQIN